MDAQARRNPLYKVVCPVGRCDLNNQLASLSLASGNTVGAVDDAVEDVRGSLKNLESRSMDVSNVSIV